MRSDRDFGFRAQAYECRPSRFSPHRHFLSALPTLRKKEDVRLVCSAWFEDSSDGTLVLGNVRDPTRYSAWSCFGSVDLALVPGSIDTFKFVDETHRRDLTAALELTVAGSTQRDCVAEVPVVQAESAAAAQARRQAAEFMRAEKARESQSRDVREVERAPGKRRATRPVLN